MEFKNEIKINDEVYEFVDIQRDGLSAIYKNMASYLRIGAPSKISKDLAFHKKMEAYGFPVASLLVEGEHEGQLYFIEESLGEKCFGYIFKEETEKYGQIQEETFDQFIAITLKFAKTQLNTVTEEKNWIDFEKGIHLGDIFQ
jgi:hypothetical protein